MVSVADLGSNSSEACHRDYRFDKSAIISVNAFTAKRDGTLVASGQTSPCLDSLMTIENIIHPEIDKN